jgi:ribose 5-phosphate isomerase A
MSEDLKRKAGAAAADLVKDGQVVGLGTGSTARHAIARLGERMKVEGISITGVPTSAMSERQAQELGIPLKDASEVEIVDIAIDGADEVDPQLNLTKGMGGALYREKVVASLAAEFVVIADESKLVKKLGTRSPLPVEVARFGWKYALHQLREKCRAVRIKEQDGKPFITDNGNYIAEMQFGPEGIDDPKALNADIVATVGVLETGLFLGMATRALVAGAAGVRELRRR